MPIYGVVKEEEKPPPIEEDKMLGVAEFESAYFCGPLLLSDEARSLYEFLGNKPIFSFGVSARYGVLL